MDESATKPFEYRRRVEFADTDMAGIAHFTAILRYMEEAEHAFLRSKGLDVFTESDGETISWPRVRVEGDFHQPARFNDVVAVTVTVEELAAKSVTYVFEIHVDGKRAASGRTVVVCCKVSASGALESIEIPSAIRAKLAAGS